VVGKDVLTLEVGERETVTERLDRERVLKGGKGSLLFDGKS
jgi:hypothetical protein